MHSSVQNALERVKCTRACKMYRLPGLALQSYTSSEDRADTVLAGQATGTAEPAGQ